MHSRSLVLATLVSAAALAVPVINKRQDGEEKYHGSDDGNTRLTFENKSIQLGVAPIDDVLSAWKDKCKSTVCFEDGVSIDTTFYTDKEEKSAKITLSTEGDYQAEDKENMIEALTAAARELVECKTVTYDWEPVCQSMSGGIPLCQDESPPEDHEQCTIPHFWVIQYTNAENKDSIIKVTVESEVEADDDFDWCTKIAGAGGAVAGLLNPIAGGAFGLAGIFCS